MKIDPVKEIRIEGVALKQTVLPNGIAITKNTVVTLVKGAKLTAHGKPIGEIISIEHKDRAWHYTAEITDPAVFQKIIANQ